MGVRRKRIKPEQPAMFWDELARLPIASEPALTPVEAKAVLALSEKHGLTVYDAVYLELAGRKQLPLGTLDNDLRRAGLAENVVLL
jgi:predicted nucleic acid-binding protein